ncbi:MAG: hypothetical protein GF346_07750 [Candidatus Eisenbacteria bacterium]|nr:hypothetical protein [Candidatus Latescibacterota bacterium]MBD3302326.1 hypothetical protein [Candidatus Eisenbacteria bacterium]
MRLCAKIAGTMILGLMTATAAFAVTYEVTIENEIPGGLETGQPFSPPVAVVHDAGYSQWVPGGEASPGLELVAREGDPSVLEMEALDSPNVYDVVIGNDGPFLDTAVFTIEGEPGQLFSVAWMLGRTNDLFSGLYDVILPKEGSIEFDPDVWDSGTEENTGLIEHLGFYGFPNAGPDEDALISMIDSYTVHNDPDYGELSWDFPPNAHVTIRVEEPTAAAETTWGSVKTTYR